MRLKSIPTGVGKPVILNVMPSPIGHRGPQNNENKGGYSASAPGARAPSLKFFFYAFFFMFIILN
jgi:hypothetical protein